MVKTYGPYLRKDGRMHVVHWYGGVTYVTQSYPRYLMEIHLGRILEPWEHVDHIDDDKTNNSIDNLQLLTIKENNQKKHPTGRTMVTLVCPMCDNVFTTEKKYLKSNKRLNRETYCSRSCSATAGGIASGVSRRKRKKRIISHF